MLGSVCGDDAAGAMPWYQLERKRTSYDLVVSVLGEQEERGSLLNIHQSFHEQ